MQLEVTDASGTVIDVSYHRIDVDCAVSTNADGSDTWDTSFDYNGDCIVSLPDFAIFAAQWLDCNTSKYEGTCP